MSRRELQRPTRTAAGTYDDFREDHPAYAMIGAYRTSSSPGAFLAGSDFQHQHLVTITIRKASMRRGLGSDHFSGSGRNLIEVALSEAQWATFVSSMNVGDGVPCTLEALTVRDADGTLYPEDVPGIAPITDRREQLRGEVKENLDTAVQAIRDSIAAVDAAPLSGRAKKELKDRLELALRELGPNLDFTASQFDKHAEKTIERAKIEINAYFTAYVQRAGIAALRGEPPLLTLAEGDTIVEVPMTD